MQRLKEILLQGTGRKATGTEGAIGAVSVAHMDTWGPDMDPFKPQKAREATGALAANKGAPHGAESHATSRATSMAHELFRQHSNSSFNETSAAAAAAVAAVMAGHGPAAAGAAAAGAAASSGTAAGGGSTSRSTSPSKLPGSGPMVGPGGLLSARRKRHLRRATQRSASPTRAGRPGGQSDTQDEEEGEEKDPEAGEPEEPRIAPSTVARRIAQVGLRRGLWKMNMSSAFLLSQTPALLVGVHMCGVLQNSWFQPHLERTPSCAKMRMQDRLCTHATLLHVIRHTKIPGLHSLCRRTPQAVRCWTLRLPPTLAGRTWGWCTRP